MSASAPQSDVKDPNPLNPSDPFATFLKTIAQSGVTSAVVATTGIGVKQIWRKYIEADRPHQYSSTEIQALATLKDLYETHLEVKGAPEEWKLDSDSRPTHAFKGRIWKSLISREVQKRDTLGLLHHYVRSYVGLASGFLADRRLNRWFDKGYEGDYIEQCFATEIQFGLMILSSLDATPQNITILEKRLRYLEAVLREDGIFVNSWLAHMHTHVSTWTEMVNCLKECKDYMQYASELYGAREVLHQLKVTNEELLSSGFDFLYHLRSHEVHVPMTMAQWYETDDKGVVEINAAHNDIFNTHTGAMLRNVRHAIGHKAFGALEINYGLLPDVYFESEASKGSIAEDMPAGDGVPIWVEDADESYEFVELYHTCCKELVLLAQTHQFVALAHELTGLSGDIWAYGSNEGKAVINTINAIISFQLTKTKDAMARLHRFSEAHRTAYFRKMDIGSNDPRHRLWVVSNTHFEESQKFFKSAETTFNTITIQMSNFPKNVNKKLHEKRQELYTNVTQFIKIHRPDLEAQVINFSSLNQRLPENLRSNQNLLQPEQKIEDLELKLPLVQANGFAYLSNDQRFIPPNDVDLINRARRVWRVGDDYDAWAYGFIERNKTFFLGYQNACDYLEQSLADLKYSPIELKQQKRKIVLTRQESASKVLLKIREKLEDQKPCWRFYWVWGCIPIPFPFKSIGWPFRSGLAQAFYEHINKLINHYYQELNTKVTQQMEQAIAFIPEDLPEEDEIAGIEVGVKPKITVITSQKSQALYADEDDEAEADKKLEHFGRNDDVVVVEESDSEPDDDVEDLLADEQPERLEHCEPEYQPRSSPTKALQLLQAAIPAPKVISSSNHEEEARQDKERDKSHLTSALQTIMRPIQLATSAHPLPLVELTKVKLNMLMRVSPQDVQLPFLQQIAGQLQVDGERRYLNILLKVLDPAVAVDDKRSAIQQYLEYVAQSGHPKQLTLPAQVQTAAQQQNLKELWDSIPSGAEGGESPRYFR